MKDVEELISQYGLEEDPEHVIIPFIDKDGTQKKRYLLKRRFIRIVYADGYFVDYPLADVIRATVRNPELLLSEALYLMYREAGRESADTVPHFPDKISIREMQSGEEDTVSSLIREGFFEFISPLYSEEGREEFLKYIDPGAIRERNRNNHVLYVADDRRQNRIAGIIEIRNFNHISLLFVEKQYQRRGVGRSLLNRAKELCSAQSVHEITVNASTNAVLAYEAFGFRISGEEKETNGIRYVPMTLIL
jgi:GNAT superfamily N-acetyltransferase